MDDPTPRPLPDLRASDADRERVAAALTRAGAATTALGPRVVDGAPGGASWVVSILGGSDRKGRWRVAKRCTVVNVMGGSDLDLCDAELTDRVTQLNVYSLMGGADINVPDGVDVQVSKFALLGGNDVELGDHVPPPGSPVLRIRMVSVMGGGNVRRGRKLNRRERRELERGD